MSKARDNQDGNKDIKALLEMARALAATCDLDKLLQMVVDYSMDLLDAERATVFLYDRETEELVSRVAEGTSEFRIAVKTGLAGAAACSLKIVNVPDVYQDERFNPEVDKKTGFRTRNILSCPLTNYDGKLVGVLQVLNKRTGAFDQNDITLAEAFSSQAGIALQRAYLLDEYLEKQRLEDSLRIAHEIQERLFPQEAPPLPGFDIACWNRPCDATGGDFCDFLSLSETKLLVTLGDVTGHGVGPALVSSATRAMLRALGSVDDRIDEVISKVNVLLTADLHDNRFVTVFIGILESSSKGRLSYCSAGQGPLLWLHAKTNQVDVLSAGGIPVGILAEAPAIPCEEIEMEAGDVFGLLTDGFYEWSRSDGEMFGVERVSEVIRSRREKSAQVILDTLKAATEDFADTCQADDLTAIIIKKI